MKMMIEQKRFTLRIHPKDMGVKIFDNIDEDNWRVLNLHFDNYEDAQFVRNELETVVNLLNNLNDENMFLKKTIKKQADSNEECSKIIEDLVNEIKHLKS